jgi:hypothetical protein
MKFGGYGILALLVLAGGLYMFSSYSGRDTHLVAYKEATFRISGQEVTLGTSVRYFGNEVAADLNKDGVDDIAFLITQENGGSGTFFYLVGAIRENGGYRGTQAMLIGDRIAPQTTEFRDGLILINYAERRPGEPFTTPPSVGRTLYAKYDPIKMDFGEVVQNFEGESATGYPKNVSIGEPLDIGRMTITVLEVIEDSRCPVDVQCIQAGTVRVRASINSMNRDFIFELGAAPQWIEDTGVSLEKVIPVSKKAGVIIEPSEYRFTFSFIVAR